MLLEIDKFSFFRETVETFQLINENETKSYANTIEISSSMRRRNIFCFNFSVGGEIDFEKEFVCTECAISRSK